jgi:hypothetical protein
MQYSEGAIFGAAVLRGAGALLSQSLQFDPAQLRRIAFLSKP